MKPFSLNYSENTAFQKGNAVFSPIKASSFSLAVSVKDGPCYEAPEEDGWGHFIEHMNLQETSSFKSFSELSLAAEASGARLEAHTGRDEAVFHICAPSWALRDSFRIMKEIFTFHNFSRKASEGERKIIRQEALREEAMFRRHFPMKAEGFLLSPLPISRYGLGSEESLQAATAERLSEYKQKIYCRQNSFMSLCGQYDNCEAYELASEFFESLPDGKERTAENRLETGRGLERNESEAPSSEKQDLCVLGFRLPENAGRMESMLYNTLTGTGFSSLFYRKLRQEKQLVYTTASYLRRYPGCGTFRLFFSVNPSDYEEARKSSIEVIESIASGKTGTEDLESAKNRLWSSVVMRLSNIHDYGLFMNRNLIITGKARLLSDFKNELESITGKDLADFAASYINESNCTESRAKAKQ